MRSAKALLFLIVCALAAPRLCRAAQMFSSFEEKIRYERALEQKADEILLKMLGPNQARVTVDVTLKIEEAFGAGRRGEDPQTRFIWVNAAQKKEKVKELLPGFTASAPVSPMGEEEAKAYNYKVSKLSVNIIAGGELAPARITEVRDLVERVLGLDKTRGDTIDVVRMQFAPVWRTIWYSPEYMGLFIRYGIVAVVIIISFMLIGFGIIKMAGAMGQVARTQEHEVSIGFSGETPAGGPPALPEPVAAEKEKREPEKEAAPETEDDRLIFNVRRAQVPLLASILRKEDPENISLVVYHLTEDIRRELLSALGKELASRVIANLVKVRFVDRDMITEIKEELERRLESAVGGMNNAMEMVAAMPYCEKKDILGQFAACDPGLASEMRSVFLFDEDLLSLSEKDMAVISTAPPLSLMAEVFPVLLPELQKKIKKQLTEKTVQMIEQTIKYSRPNRRKQEEAMDKFMEIISTLVRDGKIPKPPPAAGLIASDKPGPELSPAAAAPGEKGETERGAI